MVDQDKKPTASSASDGQSKNKRWKKKRTGNKSVIQPTKFRGGKEELDGNYFDCTGCRQLDRFMKTVQKIADHIGQEYRVGGVTRTEVMTQVVVVILAPARPVGTRVAAADGAVTITPPDVLDISDYQNAKKIVDYQVQHQTENCQRIFSLVWQHQCTESMHAKIKAHCDYPAIEQALNGIDLLRIIKLICFNIEDEKYAPCRKSTRPRQPSTH
jgi:hypothetical protein